MVAGTIDQLELTPHRKKLAGRLSGGMKRKLCVAVALIGDPEVSYTQYMPSNMPKTQTRLRREFGRLLYSSWLILIVCLLYDVLCVLPGGIVGRTVRWAGSGIPTQFMDCYIKDNEASVCIVCDWY